VILGFRHEGADFYVITQRVVIISYRRFGTTYLSHSQGSRISLTDEDIPWRGVKTQEIS